MHTESLTTRLRIGIASLVALATVAFLAAFAGAATAGQVLPPPGIQPGPGTLDLQATNIPYLAWRGEEVRLVKCFLPAELGQTVAGVGPPGLFVIEDWGGDPHQRPQFETPGGLLQVQPFVGVGEEVGRTCYAIDVVSLKAGIAVIKLSVGGTGDVGPVAKHQFLVAWMNIQQATLTDHGPREMPLGSGAAGVCEAQQLTLPGATAAAGTTFRLTFGTQTTANITVGATAAATAANIQAALAALTNIGAGNVIVHPGTAAGTFVITFCGTLAGQNVPQLVFVAGTATGGTVTTISLSIFETLCETVENNRCVNFVVEASAGTTALAVNHVRVLVTGTIPMLGNFAEVNRQLGRADNAELVMPRDWPALAGVLARTSIPGHERNPLSWDIHDEFTPGLPIAAGATRPAPPADVHQAGGACAAPAGTTDNVDNCLGGNELGPFSRFIHQFATAVPTGAQAVTLADMTLFTVGPFDPKRRDTSYIPNGVLDQGDAPMPAARVDFNLNGTVGMLIPVDKHVIYSRSGAGTSAAHDLYGPFNAAFLPATAAQRPFLGTLFEPGTTEPNLVVNQDAGLGTTASGVDGPASGNNFHGFLNNAARGGLYHYWDFAVGLATVPTLIRDCPPFVPGVTPQTRGGFDNVTVYTDEHGEARVGFFPGFGFPLPAGVVRNANGGCDIQGINPLGTATITAIARYPFQPITAADVPATGSVTKTVLSRFNKQITCVPKGPGLANQVAFICTAQAIGANGAPFVGETVCFISNAEAIMAAPGFTAVPTPPDIRGAAVMCVLTNASGQASVEVFGKGTLNVIAFFVDEGLLRFISLAPPTTVPLTPGGTAPTPPPAPVTSTTQPTQSQVVSLGGQTQPQQPTTIQKPATLVSAKLVVKKGKRALVVRVRSTKPKAKIKVVLSGRKGTLATAVRTVATNRAATVPNLRIPRGASRVTVSVIS